MTKPPADEDKPPRLDAALCLAPIRQAFVRERKEFRTTSAEQGWP